MMRRGDSFLLRRHTPKFQNPCWHYASRIAQHSCWSPPKKELNESLVYSQCRWLSAVPHMTGPLIVRFTKSPCARFRHNLSLSNKPKTETWCANKPSTIRELRKVCLKIIRILLHTLCGAQIWLKCLPHHLFYQLNEVDSQPWFFLSFLFIRLWNFVLESEWPGNRCVCLSWLLRGM